MAQVLFISHGSPMEALHQGESASAWLALTSHLERPARIVVVSAHWSSFPTRLTGSQQPATMHDFSGFPESLYALDYPAPGHPQLAREIACRLSAAGLQSWIDPGQGLDHGMWVPLRHLYPEADIPVVGMSISVRHDPDWHYRLGRRLAQALEDDTLLICSGSITHNLSDTRGPEEGVSGYVDAFQSWISHRMASRDDATLLEYRRWAPGAVRAHPTEEHLLPLFVALGAGDSREPQRFNAVVSHQALAMDAYLFERAPIEHAFETPRHGRSLVSVGR
ncbi:DODA-type extradiol aromatic ring-opening family dioxygenase [Kushneria indalinina]|uniref:4,5-DOPA dioxygenase extradiol n=1 Tax=Kushneria indalinina DSM 14324 TaxID=1122140 RepID=A0A3D9DXJ1_9GAMM|nr:class III extradiol ring-cleavage dioxygenase [Kushneria indalinina]REC95421.1 4,5-DOPA dioxygenase extradiol [Kushneria indalinina DSM 14324]